MIVELKCSKKARERLDTAFKQAVGASETVRHLIPRIEVEISDLDPSIETGDVEVAVRGFFEQDSEMEFEVSQMKTSYRGNKKAYVLLEEVRALKLLKAAHIKSWKMDSRKQEKKKRGEEDNIASRWPPP